MLVRENDYPEESGFPQGATQRHLARVRAAIRAMARELRDSVDHSLAGKAGGEHVPERPDGRYLRVNQIALAAFDAARLGGFGIEAAKDAAILAGEAAAVVRASGMPDHAVTEAGAATLERITGCDARVAFLDGNDAPYGEYDAQDGVLILYLPLKERNDVVVRHHNKGRVQP